MVAEMALDVEIGSLRDAENRAARHVGRHRNEGGGFRPRRAQRALRDLPRFGVSSEASFGFISALATSRRIVSTANV